MAVSVGIAIVASLGTASAADLSTTWDYVVRNDPSGAPQMVLARVRNADGGTLWLSCVKPQVTEGPGTDIAMSATISGKTYLGPSETRGRSTVIWFDERPPKVDYWIYRGRYGQLRGEDNVRGFIGDLVTSQRLVVELSNYRYEHSKSEFNLEPSATKIIADRLRRDCRKLVARQS